MKPCQQLYEMAPIDIIFTPYGEEPRHTHVDREKLSAKYWLDPDVSLEANHGYSRKELRDIERIIRENLETLRNEWDSFCHADSH